MLDGLRICDEIINPKVSATSVLAAVIDASKESTANTTPTDTISSDSIINKDTLQDHGAPILRSTSISRRRSRMEASSIAFRPSRDETKINIDMPSSTASTLPTSSHS